MVNDVCALIFKKMEQETEPVAPKEHVNRLVVYMLFTMCFGRKWELVCITENTSIHIEKQE